MIDFEDPTPIATPEEFRKALLAVRDSGKGIYDHKELPMIEAQYYSPKHTINTTQLAEKVGFTGYSEANLNYGILAHRIADELKYVPGSPNPNCDHWWRTLSYGKTPDQNEEIQFYKWVMRPELVQALEKMGWVKKNSDLS
ncbi:MAG: hypothetical protein IT188_06935 [Acidobacteria bacterium]|jgi:predicted HNH restriction endonuclease|nr:hypothetical protein [Acidobacteriota bacterium]MDD8010527.1 hypothetical protein [Acidobacteriota bacterium]HOU48405.1 hypothetical protein [Candidatus Aminicenantes bacterium]HQF97457.1 hypothetical protein [Candidatus Aminicenantes bacterium]HQJ41978.1 hypothetical protein [Candidatus Aminicenantes bacterium]